MKHSLLYKSDAISCIDNNKGFVVLNLLPKVTVLSKCLQKKMR